MTNLHSSASGRKSGTVQDSNPGLLRLLKALVIGLGLAIVIGLGAVAIRIVQLAQGPAGSPEQSAPQAIASPNAGAKTLTGLETRLDLPAGAVIKSVALNGNRVAAHFSAPGGDGIAVVDLETGRLVAKIGISSPAP